MNRLDRMKNKGLIQEYNITENFVPCDYRVIVIFEFNYRKYYVAVEKVSHQMLNYGHELEDIIKYEMKNLIDKI